MSEVGFSKATIMLFKRSWGFLVFIPLYGKISHTVQQQKGSQGEKTCWIHTWKQIKSAIKLQNKHQRQRERDYDVGRRWALSRLVPFFPCRAGSCMRQALTSALWWTPGRRRCAYPPDLAMIYRNVENSWSASHEPAAGAAWKEPLVMCL